MRAANSCSGKKEGWRTPRRAHGAFFNEMRLQRAIRAMALRASSAPLMRQTVHPGFIILCDRMTETRVIFVI